MSESRTPYATDKSGAQPDRHEPDLIGALVGRLGDKIERLAAELEQGKQARVEMAEELAAREQLIEGMTAEIDVLHMQKNRLKAKLRDAQNERAVERMAADNVEKRRQALDAELSKAWHQLKALEDERDELRATINDKEKEINGVRFARKVANDAHDRVLQNLYSMSEGNLELRKEIEKLRATIAEQSRDVVNTVRQRDELAQKVAELEKEIEWLKQPRVVADGPDKPWMRYPGASSYPPILRYHCELCGQNLESYTVIYKCKQCGSVRIRQIDNPQ